MKRLTKNTRNRMIAGVCAGLADYFNIDPTIVRLILAIFTLAGGAGLLIYIVAWLVMPSD